MNTPPLPFAQARQEHVVASVEWDKLLQAIQQQRCVLFLGPDLQPGTDLFGELCRHLGLPDHPQVAMPFPADELFLFPSPRARSTAAEQIEEFYEQQQGRWTGFYEKVASLPFHLIISASPDMGLSRVFDRLGVAHQFSYYHRRKVEPDPPYDKIVEDPKNQRLIFNLFGRTGKLGSLVLSHDDLFDYLRNILGAKGLSHEDYEKLHFALTEATNFLFLGFQFKKWYMQLLLRLLNPDQDKGRQYALNPALADETLVFYGKQFEIKFVDSHTPEQFLDELSRRWADFAQPLEELATSKQLLLNWHKQGHLLRILERLEKTAQTSAHPDLSTAVAMQFSRYNTLQNQVQHRAIMPDQASVLRNQIALAVLELIRNLPD